MKKLIIALVGSFALLANTGMIAAAFDSNAETMKVAETEAVPDSAKTTLVSSEKSDETSSSDTEAMTPAEEGAEVRKNLAVKTMDIIMLPSSAVMYDKDGNVQAWNPGSIVWVIGVDDENQQYRLFAPDVGRTDCNCMYVKYSDVSGASIISHKGMVIGDLTFDGRVDVFDLCLMKRGYIYGWEDDKKMYYMSDMNADGDVSIADIVYLQQWLLGMIR